MAQQKPEKEKKAIWKRPLFWVALVIVLMAIGNSGKKDSNTQTVTTGTQASSSAPTTTPKEVITITHGVFTNEGSGLYKVDGEATNNDTSQHDAILKATFYDGSGNILGTATGSVNGLAAGQTKTFTLVGTDNVAGYKTMKVQVDTLL